MNLSNRTALLVSILLLIGLASAACDAHGANVLVWGRELEGQNLVPDDLTNAVTLAAGPDYTLALRADGTLHSWGAGAPAGLPPSLSNAVSLAAGNDFSLALQEDGTLLGWGAILPPPGLSNVVAIAASRSHAVAVRSDGTVVCWGSNLYGQTNVPPGLSNIVAVSCAARWTLALHRDGSMSSWGLNGGAATNIPPGSLPAVAIASGSFHNLAVDISGGVQAGGPGSTLAGMVPESATNAVAAAGGFNHSLGLLKNGTVLAWGDNTQGQTNQPAGLTNVVTVAAGTYHSVALQAEPAPSFWRQPPAAKTLASGRSLWIFPGVVGLPPLQFQWQRNGTNLPGAQTPWLYLERLTVQESGTYSLRVSNAYGVTQSEPVQVLVEDQPPVILSQPVSQTVPVLGEVSLEITAGGSTPVTYQWYRNGLSVPDETNTVLTIRDASTSEAGVYSVRVANAFGAAFSAVARLTVPSIFSWGYGPGSGEELRTPTSDTEVVGIAASTTDTFFRFRDGTVFSARSNAILPWSNVAAVAAGDWHGLAIHSNGAVSVLQSGGGFPLDASGVTNAQMMAGGSDRAVALLSNGTIRGWGQASAQPGLSNVVSVACGHQHWLALLADGTVQQFGLGPVPDGLTNARAIAGGYFFSAALREDGSVSLWGLQAANMKPSHPGASNVVALAARDFLLMGLCADGTVVSWAMGNSSEPTTPRLRGVVEMACGTSHNVVRLQPADYRPHLTAIQRGTDWQFSLPTELGRLYTLEHSTTLSPAAWETVRQIPGDGFHQDMAIDPPDSTGFYRIRVD